MAEEQQPKIIIDSDWKSQAQAEKERLARKEQEGGPSSPQARRGELPEPNFEELVRLLATQALVYLGAFPDPQSGRAIVALDMAQLHVDLLNVLREKSKGNLSDDESKMLDATLSELRLAFADVSAAVTKAVDEGRVQRAPAPGAAGSSPLQTPSPEQRIPRPDASGRG